MDMKKPICHDDPDWDEVLACARAIAKRSSNLTASWGNSSVLFAMFVLEHRLMILLRDPSASLDDILLVTDSIAVLNDTLKLYNTPLNST